MNLTKFLNCFKEESKNINNNHKLNNYLYLLDELEGNHWEKYKCTKQDGKIIIRKKYFVMNIVIYL